jgi:type I restriction enzyme R subunit
MDIEQIRRRQLPHWDVPGATYFVTTCLEGSIPAQGLLELNEPRHRNRSMTKPDVFTQDQWNVRLWKLQFKEIDEWLDAKPARRDLESPELAQIVVNAMFHFAGNRYDLLAYVVMPSHIHWVFTPLASWTDSLSADDKRSPRERILYSFNRFTATQCNKLLQTQGAFWQGESYDHWIRHVDELERIILYVEANPVKAQLVTQPDQWKFSSANYRKVHGLAMGVPLVKMQSGL